MNRWKKLRNLNACLEQAAGLTGSHLGRTGWHCQHGPHLSPFFTCTGRTSHLFLHVLDNVGVKSEMFALICVLLHV